MRVQELIDILKDQPPDAEVELAIVASSNDDDDEITVDRWEVAGVLPWDADDDEEQGAGEGVVIWLIGGEDNDVDDFLDTIEDGDQGDDHDHPHGQADGHAHPN